MGRCIENIKEWLHILAQYTFHYTCPVCHTTVLYEKGICPGCLAMLETEEGARTCPTLPPHRTGMHLYALPADRNHLRQSGSFLACTYVLQLL